ncbi:MAG: hypothetical protein WD200_04620 [Candidatus Andersenbacteria bacterium]
MISDDLREFWESHRSTPANREREKGKAQGYTVDDFMALGIDPRLPSAAKPDSEDKLIVIAARYACGLPFRHEDDAQWGDDEDSVCVDADPCEGEEDDSLYDYEEIDE